MASLRCHGDSDCNKTPFIRNVYLYIIPLWQPFFHIFNHADVVNAQTWEVSTPKIQSSHLKLVSNWVTEHTSLLESSSFLQEGGMDERIF